MEKLVKEAKRHSEPRKNKKLGKKLHSHQKASRFKVAKNLKELIYVEKNVAMQEYLEKITSASAT